MLVAQKDAITKIMGIITPKSINTLENKLGGAFTILKSTHFAKGQQYRYLACLIPKEKYHIIIVDPVWVYAAPANPGTYAATALAAGVSMAQHKQIIAQHKETQMAHTKYLGAQAAGKELLLQGVGNNSLHGGQDGAVLSVNHVKLCSKLHFKKKIATCSARPSQNCAKL